ncbi:MAG: hypothetical protein JXM70_02320 [Pirellulales bacterium]|nr:hypothetical protein [Pirellulales bacterium]
MKRKHHRPQQVVWNLQEAQTSLVAGKHGQAEVPLSRRRRLDALSKKRGPSDRDRTEPPQDPAETRGQTPSGE